MLVFIDESGDPGFKVEEGSSPVFVAAMVIFANGDDAAATQNAINRSAARQAHKGEFKFSKTRADVRDLYFQAVAGCPFEVRAIVVRKELIRSAHLKDDKESFYQFFVKQMIRHDNERLVDARVMIDGSGDREFRQNLRVALTKGGRAGAVKACKFSDSKNDALIQLADMCVSAIARSFREDRQDRCRWRNILAPRIENVWVFQ